MINAVNEYEFTSDTCIGYTSKGEVFLVDIDKYDLIKDYNWCIDKNGYVVTYKRIDNKNKTIRLHRLITDAPDDLVVDHIHGNKRRFDNRISNLRVCTNQENQFNKEYNLNKELKVKGVYKTVSHDKTRYYSQITVNKKTKHLGIFDTIKEASDTYDKAAKKLFGEFAWLNNYQASEQELIEYKESIIRKLENDKIKIDREYAKLNSVCVECGVTITFGSRLCQRCAQFKARKVVRPDKDELKALIRVLPFVEIGKQFSVSDNAIRKWCKSYGLPYKHNDIKSYSDEEWINI